MISVRAYDNSHKLNRRARPHVPADVGLGHGPQDRAATGLSAKAEATDVVHEFFQQSNETDWDFVWRLALITTTSSSSTTRRRVPQGQQGRPARRSELRWQDNAHQSRPRMTGVQQVQTVEVRGWDPKGKQAVNGATPAAHDDVKAGVARSEVASDLGGGTTTVTDRAAATPGRPTRSPRARSSGGRTRSIEADGVASAIRS